MVFLTCGSKICDQDAAFQEGKESGGLKCSILSVRLDEQTGNVVLTCQVRQVKEGFPAVRGLEPVTIHQLACDGKLTKSVKTLISPPDAFVIKKTDRFEVRIDCSVHPAATEILIELGTSEAKSMPVKLPRRKRE
jgi:hypothetical protein